MQKQTGAAFDDDAIQCFWSMSNESKIQVAKEAWRGQPDVSPERCERCHMCVLQAVKKCGHDSIHDSSTTLP